ncbi:substrate-binding periplasmic protein [Halodesulfovibrio aestuarii]|uniref:Amino acid ABC transporter substrate-binding protein, PAAT family (TC 3.A.1.3.-) n=1 Tax=Halodesulfovibrio aestuarii TaxID=126333 RepID=A0A8G2F8E6_9BACT|nr:transporter substrate-binding domain-containing protein [Halodesulfovibrio aestuarii]SHI77689.1 amino acid ABC transporter substrate-binding protein, PAAT family (TC 3.A.1.3.-) [Halodesulfovibrio aestuarii]
MNKRHAGLISVIFCFLSTILFYSTVHSVTLAEIRARGELYHLGVPYARFANTNADGLDCALIRRFAHRIGVRYKFVPTSWENAIPDLTGIRPALPGSSQSVTPIRGDILANGLSIIPERKRYVLFSKPTFTAQVWLLAKPDADIDPIHPTGSVERDIKSTLEKTAGKTVYGIKNLCIDVRLFPDLLHTAGSAENVPLGTLPQPISFVKSPYSIFLMESPSALMALGIWPYSFKIIGPVAKQQNMGAAFAPTSVELKEEFDRFLTEVWTSGEYQKLVASYYPNSFSYFKTFFTKSSP